MSKDHSKQYMARKVGMAQATARTIADRAPRLLIIAGATGSGKSTAALKIAAKSKFARIISTDAIRDLVAAWVCYCFVSKLVVLSCVLNVLRGARL